MRHVLLYLKTIFLLVLEKISTKVKKIMHFAFTAPWCKRAILKIKYGNPIGRTDKKDMGIPKSMIFCGTKHGNSKQFINTVSSQTRMKTNLRTVWTAFVSFGLPYRCYAFASIVTVYAVTCSRLSQSALCSGARHHHLAIFNHIASALHESRTCLFFLKFLTV